MVSRHKTALTPTFRSKKGMTVDDFLGGGFMDASDGEEEEVSNLHAFVERINTD